MEFSSKIVEQAVDAFSQLPGVGKKTALRFVLHVIKQDKSSCENLSQLIKQLKNDLKFCVKCHNISETENCSICNNAARDNSIICVVQDYRDVMAHYQAALVLDPNNAMALRRLAQIEIAQGNTDSAMTRLAQAYAIAPGYRATRQMLGEMDAINGQPDVAAALWRTIDRRQNQLELRLSWYRDFIKDDVRADRVQDAIARTNRE